MSYTLLNPAFETVGFLDNDGSSQNQFWGDVITQEIAQQSDPLSATLQSDNASSNVDLTGSTKAWTHTLSGLSFFDKGNAEEVDAGYNVVYKDDANNRTYLMTLYSVVTQDLPSGVHYKTATGINKALYDAGTRHLTAKDFKDVKFIEIAQYIFAGFDWNVIVSSNQDTVRSYSIATDATLASVIQDLIQLYDLDVDAYVKYSTDANSGYKITLNGAGYKRTIEFTDSVGEQTGEILYYGEDYQSISKTASYGSIYTRLFPRGADDINIKSVNSGTDFVFDDDANEKYNPVGAANSPVNYLDGVIVNTAISTPEALMTWAKTQLKGLNHPRYSYTVTTINGKNMAIGDEVRVQDMYASTPILLESRIIQKTLSFSDPAQNGYVLGEFEPIMNNVSKTGYGSLTQAIESVREVANTANDTAKIANQSASDAKMVAGEAKSAVDVAVTKADEALTSANGKNKVYTSEPTDPSVLKEGDTWFTEDGDMLIYTNGAWVSTNETMKAKQDELKQTLAELDTELEASTKRLEDADAAFKVAQDAANKELDTLNNTTLPNLKSDLDANSNKLKTLNETTLPALEEELDKNTADINTLKNTTLPNLKTDLDKNASVIDNLNNSVLPNLQTALDVNESDINELKNTTIPQLNQSLADASKTAADATKTVADNLAKEASDRQAAITAVNSAIDTAKSSAVDTATSLANQAKQDAITAASKSLGTYLVRLVPGTTMFKNTNTTTIQAQVWKAGQDITSTLATSAFTWTLSKDGATASSFATGKTSVTASPSDFTNTGVYTVKVAITVTNIDGSTTNQTFTDNVTIAKVSDGATGAKGSDGIGIKTTVVTYQLGTSGTATPTGTWSSTVPTLVKGQYLWTRTVWTYSDNTSETGYSTTYIAKDGNNGTDGIAGKDGVGITDTTITYAGSTSGTTAPTTGYTSTVPSVVAGNFLWTKTVWSYSDNTTETGYSVAKMGDNGADGKDGVAGKDAPRQVNQIINPEFSDNVSGWINQSPAITTLSIENDKQNGSNILDIVHANTTAWAQVRQQIANATAGNVVSFSVWAKATQSNSVITIDSYNASGTRTIVSTKTLSSTGQLYKYENITIPADAVSVYISIWSQTAGTVSISQPMFVFDTKVDGYTLGQSFVNSIVSTTITYATNTSGTTAPTSGYTSTIPSVAKGAYLWQRTTITYTDNTTKTSDIVTYFAKDGLKGADGMDGGQGMIAQPTKPTTGLVDGFLWLDTSQTYPVYYIYDSALGDFKIYQFNAKNINADQLKAKFVGTDRLTASQIIADDLHVKSANIDGQLQASQITVSSSDGSTAALSTFDLKGMRTSISDVTNTVNSMGQINQLPNTEFNPDLAGWNSSTNLATGSYPDGNDLLVLSSKTYNGSNAVMIDRSSRADDSAAYDKMHPPLISVYGHSTVSWRMAAFVEQASANANTYFNAVLEFFDANKSLLGTGGASGGMFTKGNTTGWQLSTDVSSTRFVNVPVPSGAYYAGFKFYPKGQYKIHLSQPMVVFDETTIGAYVQGNYNNNSRMVAAETSIDGFKQFASDGKGNMYSSVSNAMMDTTLLKGLDGSTSIQTQMSNLWAVDIQSAKTGLQSQITAGDNGVLASVSTYLSSPNLVTNSELYVDSDNNGTAGWTIDSGGFYWTGTTIYQGTNALGLNSTNDTTYYAFSEMQKIPSGVSSYSASVAFRAYSVTTGAIGARIAFYGSDKKYSSSMSVDIVRTSTTNNKWVNYSVTAAVPSGAVYVGIVYFSTGQARVYISQPMLAAGSTVIPYQPGKQNSNSTILSLFDNRFALGITNNIGTIVSGVVGDATNLAILSQNVTVSGKQITLDGNTVVKGDFTVTGGNISSGSITATQIKSATITTTQLAANTITANNIASNTITANEIKTGTITANEIAAGTITADRIKTGTITATQIATGTLTADKISAGTITSDKIATKTLTANNIATGTITATEIASGTITADNIKAGTLTASLFSAGAITSDKLTVANGFITSAMIGNATITNAKITSGLDATKITVGTLSADRIASGSITSDKLTITDGFITNAMIANGTITNAKITGGLDANKITTGTLDADKVTVINLDANSIDTGTLSGVNVTVDKTLSIASGGQITWPVGGTFGGYAIDPFWIDNANGGSVVFDAQQSGTAVIKTDGTFDLRGTITASAVPSGNPVGYAYDGQNTMYAFNRIGLDGILVKHYLKESDVGVNVAGFTKISGSGITVGQQASSPFFIADAYNNNVAITSSTILGTMNFSGLRDYQSTFAAPSPNARIYRSTSGGMNIRDTERIAIASDDSDGQIIIESHTKDTTYTAGYRIASTTMYTTVSSGSANVVVNSSGTIFRSSSATKYKTDIQHDATTEKADKLLTLDPATWLDKGMTESSNALYETGQGDALDANTNRRYAGLIAEDLVRVGLEQFVDYNGDTGEVEGIHYDRLWTVLLPAIKQLREQINELQWLVNKENK